MKARSANPRLRTGPGSVVIAVALFVLSAAFVVWRNSQVAAFVDIGYILNNATRIALGDVPYQQFPLAQAPGEFLVQAALIKAFGPHFAVQIGYAAIVGGLASALTYLVARRLLDGAVAASRPLAAILAMPLVPLGVYAILPNPFYDPDACLAALAGILAVLAARDRSTRARWLVAGAMLSGPLVIKQNIGGAYLLGVVAVLGAEAIQRPSARAGVRWCIAGCAAALAVELAALQVVVGLDSYVRWTIGWAMSGRGLSLARFREFTDPLVIWPAALILLLAAAGRSIGARWRGPLFLTGLLVPLAVGLAAPAAIVNVPQMFPPLLIAAVALAGARTLREGVRFDIALPFVLGLTTLGTLQSQGVGGSTYGIFPLLVLAIATLVRDIAFFVPAPRRLAPLVGAVIALVLMVAGAGYTVANVRLRFVDVNAPGPVVGSTFPSLAGLSAGGPYISDLDATLTWLQDNVSADESFVFVPGEDPAYFALDRKPVLPSVWLYVGDIATPYTPTELSAFADAAGLRWVIVKDHLQVRGDVPGQQELVARLTDRAMLVTRIGAFRIFRR